MPEPPLPTAAEIVALHDRCLLTPGWPRSEVEAPADPIRAAVLANHRCNSLLWAEEDLARRTTVADAEIAANKRAIDRHNQARNDATERIDEGLLVALKLVDEAAARTDAPASTAPPGARLASETAGSIVDRLSIVALKIAAMALQAARTDTNAAQRAAAATKLARLREQRADLAGCFDALLADARAGRAYFKVYRQFKMYNDPQMNPVLVREREGGRGAQPGAAG